MIHLDQISRRGALLVAMATLAAVAGCGKVPEPPPPAPEPRVEGDHVQFPAGSKQLAVIRIVDVQQERSDAMRIQGRLVWDEGRTARVDAPIAGRVTRLMAAPGDRVAAGAPLAQLVSAEIGQAQADARRADTDLDAARKNHARIQELADAGVVPAKDLQAAEADLARAGSERERAAARERLYGGSGRVDQAFVLRSPIAGVVVQRHATPGLEVRPDMAQGDAPPLFLVSDPLRLWAQIDVPESAANRVAVGQTLTLRAPALPNRPIHATVLHVSDYIDPETRMLRARADIDNADRRLKAEMFVTGDLSLAAIESASVPSTAVFLAGDHYYAFVQDGPGRFVRRKIDAEEGGFGQMRILSGLKPGERVVTEGALLLQHLLTMRR